MAGRGFGAKIAALFRGGKTEGESFYEELEDLLIEGDVGATAAMDIADTLRRSAGAGNREERLQTLKNILADSLRTAEVRPVPGSLNFFMVLGVNGVGKTTTVAKLADYFRRNYGMEAVLAAGDTFRAAAIDQLKLHGLRLDVRVVHQQPGSDPGAVIYDTIESVKAKSGELIIADTAGRMHNRSDLIRELKKIDKVARGRMDGGNYTKLLVIDATTGQNGIRQAEIFHEAIGVDGVILAKYDSDAKGGIVFSISRTLKIPLVFLGTGEKYEDLRLFDPDRFLSALLGVT